MAERPPLAGRIIGYVFMVVVVAGAARLVWELLQPLVPVLVTLLGLVAVFWVVVRRPF